ncbi:MAG: hypothetical protein ACRCUC_11170 [Aestuariivirga sp.]
MVDLTKITTPFALLDEVYGAGTQEALKAHGGPYEILYHTGQWSKYDHHGFGPGNTYRVKPVPPKPREWWITLYDGMAWDDEATAKLNNLNCKDVGSEIVHVREVLP